MFQSGASSPSVTVRAICPAKVVSNTESLDVAEIHASYNANGYQALVVYVDAVEFKIPHSRRRQITLALKTARYAELVGVSLEDARSAINRVFGLIRSTLLHLVASFKDDPMSPLEAWMLPNDHPAVARALTEYANLERRYDKGLKWKDPDHEKGHPRFFALHPELTFEPTDINNAAIPWETRFGQCYNFLTHREQSVVAAMCTLVHARQGHGSGEFVCDPSRIGECGKSAIWALWAPRLGHRCEFILAPTGFNRPRQVLT
jgi:hypothetical protein